MDGQQQAMPEYEIQQNYLKKYTNIKTTSPIYICQRGGGREAACHVWCKYSSDVNFWVLHFLYDSVADLLSPESKLLRDF